MRHRANGVSQDFRIGSLRDCRWVSKARLVFTAVIVEGHTQSEVPACHRAEKFATRACWAAGLV